MYIECVCLLSCNMKYNYLGGGVMMFVKHCKYVVMLQPPMFYHLGSGCRKTCVDTHVISCTTFLVSSDES